uniref:non-specific serine/threonine protein kinase n=1 Tax=Clastoptera arizonana TaxID=38151 RepID=A0A1B6CSP7_9HEMI
MNTIAQNHNSHIAVTSENNNANIVAADNESHNQPRPPPSQSRKLSSVSTATPTSDSGLPLVNYSELEAATNRWDRTCILGRGGFGTVYKGSWKNTLVAIKKLETQKANMLVSTELLEAQRQQSLRELKYLNSCRHDNILPLYGYSVGGEASCLVYQFMINGSLEDRLMCRQDSKPISWLQRHRIATGTACGLQFLHSVGDKPLVHGDIKSANILLDSHLEPRIGDFGLAREGPLQQYTHVKVSRVHGTRPYLPDEFLRGKKFSTKVDTFSFGIVLFELATGLRAYEENRHHKYLKDHVEETDLPELADPKAGPDKYAIVQSLLNLGKWCTKTLAKNRPDMVIVLQTLNSLPRDVNILNQNSPTHSNNEMQQNRECVSPGPKKLSPSTQKLSASPNQTPVHMKTKQTPVALQIPVPIIHPPPTHQLLTPPKFGNASVSPRSVSPNTPVQQLPTEMTVPPSFSPNFPDLFMQKSEVDALIPSIGDAIGCINIGNNRLDASPAPCDDLPLMTELGIKPLENDHNNIT